MHAPLELEVDEVQNDVEYSYQQRTPMWGEPQPKDDFDYCISLIIDDNTKASASEKKLCRQDYFTASSSRDSIAASSSFLDPLIFFGHKSDNESSYDESATNKHIVDDFDSRDFVDICDEDILSMWKSNSE